MFIKLVIGNKVRNLSHIYLNKPLNLTEGDNQYKKITRNNLRVIFNNGKFAFYND